MWSSFWVRKMQEAEDSTELGDPTSEPTDFFPKEGDKGSELSVRILTISWVAFLCSCFVIFIILSVCSECHCRCCKRNHLMAQGREHTFGQKDRSRGDLFCWQFRWGSWSVKKTSALEKQCWFQLLVYKRHPSPAVRWTKHLENELELSLLIRLRPPASLDWMDLSDV